MTDGVSRTETTGNIVADLSDTSRELDPSFTPSLVPNATWAEGKWRALASDIRPNTVLWQTMLANQIAIGSGDTATPCARTSRRWALKQVTGKHGMWELKGCRQNHSASAVSNQRAVGPDASQVPRCRSARYPKDKAVADPDLLIADWRDRLGKTGFELPSISPRPTNVPRDTPSPPAGTDIASREPGDIHTFG